mgnify:FL=1
MANMQAVFKTNETMNKGTVVRNTGSHYTVRDSESREYECCIKGRFKISGIKSTNPVAVGDRVEFLPSQANAYGLICGIEERKNYIVRKATKLSKQTHVIAANMDQALLVVTAVLPRTSTGFIDRFLLTCEAYNIPCVLVFNKIDLYDDEIREYADYMKSIYENIGYTCIETSAIEKTGLEKLERILQNKTSLLSGHSGVGKSALVNALDSSLNLKTSAVSLSNLKGRHTTTFAQMYPLAFGGDIIDTPGIRSFGMVDFKAEEVARYYPEMRARLANCKYYNCTHIHEPGCAIKKAVEEGEISPERYANYVNIVNGEEVQMPQWQTK